MRLPPGEPFAYTGASLTPVLRAQLREEFGYNKPVGVQLLLYVKNVAHGNLGYSTAQHRPAAQAIADAVPRTLALAIVGLILSFIVGIAIGSVAAAKRYT